MAMSVDRKLPVELLEQIAEAIEASVVRGVDLA